MADNNLPQPVTVGDLYLAAILKKLEDLESRMTPQPPANQDYDHIKEPNKPKRR